MPIADAGAATNRWFTLAQDRYDWLPELSPRSIRYFRIGRAAESDASDRRLVFETLDQATEAAVCLDARPSPAAQLRALAGVGEIQLVAWAAARLYAGELKILWRDLELSTGGATTSASRPPPPRRAPAASAAPSPQGPPVGAFPPGFDAAGVAAALKAAASEGIPFCEECMKAAEAELSDAAPVPA